jgi:riboflavin synthase
MFTGIVETTALVRDVRRAAEGARLGLAGWPAARADDRGLALGESVCVSGVCLTVAALGASGDGFEADVSAETLAVTTLADVRAGDRVNVERSLRAGDRLGGHLVMGHVDGVGTVASATRVGEGRVVRFRAPAELARYLAPKGSIAVDGVSLTVNRLAPPDGFEVMLVPHTLGVTTLAALAPGRRVNLEVDVLARYVARQLEIAGVTPSVEGSRDEGILRAMREAGFGE